MSVLVVLIPPRLRNDGAAPAVPAELPWVLSTDGTAVTSHGRSAPMGLPRADSLVVALADADVAWHRIALPKAPAARLRAALGGVLEEALLDDESGMHLALAPRAAPGQLTWVAAVDGAWLTAIVAAIESEGRSVDRIVPSSWPDAAKSGHFLPPPADMPDDPPRLTFAGDDGVAILGLKGTLARGWVARHADAGTLWTAHPAAAAAAERWLESRVVILGDPERALQAARSTWNLRQFELAPQLRGMRALREGLRRLRRPEWRPMRAGVVALVLVQVAGLNAWAWHLQRGVAEKRQAMTALLQSTHPQVRAVLDAPAQMQRETELLRAAAGRAAETDLEPMLAAAAAGWPPGLPPAAALRFEPGRLTLTAPGWSEAQVAAFREQARLAGYVAEYAKDQVVLTRATQGRA